MALTIATNNGATATTDHTAGTRQATTQNVNWATDWALKSRGGNEIVLVNKTTPLDAKNRIRFQLSEVSNVYNGSNINPNYQLPARDGLSLLIQATNVLDVTDSSDAQFHAQLPISAHMVVKFPRSSLITTTILMQSIRQVWGAFSTTDAAYNDYTGLTNLMNGAINPLDW